MSKHFPNQNLKATIIMAPPGSHLCRPGDRICPIPERSDQMGVSVLKGSGVRLKGESQQQPQSWRFKTSHA